MRDGTTGLLTTGSPRAASVGASAAPVNSASHGPSRDRTRPPAPSRARIGAAGRRPGAARSVRRRAAAAWTGSSAASENSSHTSVTSSNGEHTSPRRRGGRRARSAPRAAPTAVKMIGAVRSAASSRFDTSPSRTGRQPRRRARSPRMPLHGPGTSARAPHPCGVMESRRRARIVRDDPPPTPHPRTQLEEHDARQHTHRPGRDGTGRLPRRRVPGRARRTSPVRWPRSWPGSPSPV